VASCLVHPGRSSGAHPDLHPFPTRRSSDLHQLTLALMKQGDAGGTLRAMAASLSEDFQGDLVRMVLFDEVGGVDDVDWLQVVARNDPALVPFKDCMTEGNPLCGRLQPEKNALLYGTRVEEVQSSALVPLAAAGGDVIGLLAVGSRDPNRFYPGMGTLFLRMMGEALATALQRFPDPL